MTGNQNTTPPGNSLLSEQDKGQILTGLHALGLSPEEVDRIMRGVAVATAPRPAEDIVPGWESDPHLLSDQHFTFGAGDKIVTVTLPILGIDYFWSHLLPQFEEWVLGLYRGQGLLYMQQASANPLDFIHQVIAALIRRPKNDRLKVSLYEFAAYTFSTDAELRPEFIAALPGNQLQQAVKALVEINRRNFTELWAELPQRLKQHLTLIYVTSIESIQNTNLALIQSMQRMQMALENTRLSSGGAADTGITEPGLLSEETPTPSLLS